ncbi:chromosome segregation protein SMC [Reticulomyxa filosa]|uniref:Chromosome segregation protein SMC n=1 Tax=Reticulomyxa filosa TaxID=46433 RepID=X6MG13_RETFI|nr:chromosome segregation protein SMC [Reticulomyxa filosa]|eukprot:ETO12938.1 chromosome segregation protein SMC [Reticulomyxa filosa]
MAYSELKTTEKQNRDKDIEQYKKLDKELNFNVAKLLEEEKINYKKFDHVIKDLQNRLRSYNEKKELVQDRISQEFYDKLTSAVQQSLKWKKDFVGALTTSTKHVNSLIVAADKQLGNLETAKERIMNQSDTTEKNAETRNMLYQFIEWDSEIQEDLKGIMTEWKTLRHELRELASIWKEVSEYSVQK